MRNFYVGYGAHVACEGGGRGLYMLVYEAGKRWIAREGNKSALEVTVGERMAAAAAAGCICWAAIFPADTVRSKIYAHHVLNPGGGDTPGSLDMARNIWREKGWAGFWKGVGPTIARAGPVAATVLPIYDGVLERLLVEER
jgi:solute carrier family 25 carnitine/acylcarnitine transporter 20/29